jgi:anti-sigma regulatory factor (Ser/Thr protein kinase)
MPITEGLGDAATDHARWPDPLWIRTAAHGSQVRIVRRRLAEWLGGDHLDPDLVDDLVMAASEALENCADHAFTGIPAGGTMTLTAHTAGTTLVITVADDGRWRETTSGPCRGRGLAMMRTLVDEVVVVSGLAGTHLALTHHL